MMNGNATEPAAASDGAVVRTHNSASSGGEEAGGAPGDGGDHRLDARGLGRDGPSPSDQYASATNLKAEPAVAMEPDKATAFEAATDRTTVDSSETGATTTVTATMQHEGVRDQGAVRSPAQGSPFGEVRHDATDADNSADWARDARPPGIGPVAGSEGELRSEAHAAISPPPGAEAVTALRHPQGSDMHSSPAAAGFVGHQTPRDPTRMFSRGPSRESAHSGDGSAREGHTLASPATSAAEALSRHSSGRGTHRTGSEADARSGQLSYASPYARSRHSGEYGSPHPSSQHVPPSPLLVPNSAGEGTAAAWAGLRGGGGHYADGESREGAGSSHPHTTPGSSNSPASGNRSFTGVPPGGGHQQRRDWFHATQQKQQQAGVRPGCVPVAPGSSGERQQWGPASDRHASDPHLQLPPPQHLHQQHQQHRGAYARAPEGEPGLAPELGHAQQVVSPLFAPGNVPSMGMGQFPRRGSHGVTDTVASADEHFDVWKRTSSSSLTPGQLQQQQQQHKLPPTLQLQRLPPGELSHCLPSPSRASYSQDPAAIASAVRGMRRKEYDRLQQQQFGGPGSEPGPSPSRAHVPYHAQQQQGFGAASSADQRALLTAALSSRESLPQQQGYGSRQPARGPALTEPSRGSHPPSWRQQYLASGDEGKSSEARPYGGGHDLGSGRTLTPGATQQQQPSPASVPRTARAAERGEPYSVPQARMRRSRASLSAVPASLLASTLPAQQQQALNELTEQLLGEVAPQYRRGPVPLPVPGSEISYAEMYGAGRGSEADAHRPYKCTHCSRRFAHASTLSAHKATHRNDRREYICPHPGCGKSFGRSYTLNMHKRTHTGERPYRCPVPGCGKTFTQSGSRNTHMRALHGIVDVARALIELEALEQQHLAAFGEEFGDESDGEDGYAMADPHLQQQQQHYPGAYEEGDGDVGYNMPGPQQYSPGPPPLGPPLQQQASPLSPRGQQHYPGHPMQPQQHQPGLLGPGGVPGGGAVLGNRGHNNTPPVRSPHGGPLGGGGGGGGVGLPGGGGGGHGQPQQQHQQQQHAAGARAVDDYYGGQHQGQWGGGQYGP